MTFPVYPYVTATTRQKSIGRPYALHPWCTEGPTLDTPHWLQSQLRCMCRASCVGERKARSLLSSKNLTDTFQRRCSAQHYSRWNLNSGASFTTDWSLLGPFCGPDLRKSFRNEAQVKPNAST